MTDIHVKLIASGLSINENQVRSTINLLNEGGTVPFISRYRKEATGSLDEVQILAIKENYEKLLDVDKRREAIINSIEEQGKLTDELRKKLESTYILSELEDIYLPYKQKRKTRASIAREKGLEPLAELIYKQQVKDVDDIAAKYLTDAVETVDDALQGARDIIAEWINEDLRARESIRRLFGRDALISSKMVKGKEEEGIKYKDYFEFSEPLKRCPSHRLLAMRRGEEEGFLKISI
jgi:uncharacterized protein